MGDHESSKLDHENHLLLDQPLLQLPVELLRKNLRSARFEVEKDGSFVKETLKRTATDSATGADLAVGRGPDARLHDRARARRQAEADRLRRGGGPPAPPRGGPRQAPRRGPRVRWRAAQQDVRPPHPDYGARYV
ncbi:hypothetical protein O1611_g3169 [Lasiodiplodia mahajangana]|uniref:Uncharacterized protein n=1 Tax=Lasiodiplodia mahajangana TaxID=1108764 RepID=A0ACC2JSZ0_9PEZI|nr:hypothetical protein O1611_g3169 [Lasiodiplodia mahajangana]